VQTDSPDSPSTGDLGEVLSTLPDPLCLPEDSASKKEASKTFGDAERNEEAKQRLHNILMVLLSVGAGCFCVVLIVRVLHFILPEYKTPVPWYYLRCWLTDVQLQGIDKFFFSGALGAMVSGYLKDKLLRAKTPAE
jgi:hypothetical protein